MPVRVNIFLTERDVQDLDSSIGAPPLKYQTNHPQPNMRAVEEEGRPHIVNTEDFKQRLKKSNKVAREERYSRPHG